MSDTEAADLDPATPAPPDIGQAAAEATALLERIRATPTAKPSGPSALEVGKAACAAAELDPHKVADLTEAGARAVRRVLGMPKGAPVSNWDRYTAEALQARASERWQQLDERARTEGWRTDFSRRTDSDFKTWLAGRPMFDPTYRPPTFGVQGSPPFMPKDAPAYDGAAMDAALREAARVARQTVREVEITGDGVTPRL